MKRTWLLTLGDVAARSSGSGYDADWSFVGEPVERLRSDEANDRPVCARTSDAIMAEAASANEADRTGDATRDAHSLANVNSAYGEFYRIRSRPAWSSWSNSRNCVRALETGAHHTEDPDSVLQMVEEANATCEVARGLSPTMSNQPDEYKQ